MATKGPFPRMPRTSVPDRIPAILPIQEAAGRSLFDKGHLGPSPETLEHKPRSREYVHKAISRVILPVILEDLGFMGLAEPDIRISAKWMPRQDPLPDPAELPPLVTVGLVPISVFTLVFCLLCRGVGASTTAHRRYKDAFADERIHIFIDADRNAVSMHMANDLRDALNKGFTCWAQGK